MRDNWNRLAMDITHHGGKHFLTIIDCGPSRFVIQQPLCQQNSTSVVRQLEAIFYEHGLPLEILTDNDTAFTCKHLKNFFSNWGVCLQFQCAYAPAENSIVERSHRSIKTIAVRKQCSIPEAVYWYNVTPKDNHSPATASADALYRYHTRIWDIEAVFPIEPRNTQGANEVGDVVWVKTPHGKCMTKFSWGGVTQVNSPVSAH